LNVRPAHGLLFAVLVAGASVACAAGSSATQGDASIGEGGTGGDGTAGGRDGKSDGKSIFKDGGSTLVPIGGACTMSAQCLSPGTCTMIGSAQYCSEPCPATSCPANTYCSYVNGTALCVPDLKQECLECTVPTDCKLPSDNCMTSPQGDHFCARDCTPTGTCPTGYSCMSQAAYAALVPDGGTVGVTDGGGSLDAGGGGGASDGGGPADAGVTADADVPSMWCVPSGGQACQCNNMRNGISDPCTISNAFGTCTGQQSCNGATGMESACSALTPMAEICNGKDDNCDGQIDEGDPNQLCAFMGAPPPNSSWACTNGMCAVGACNPGYTAFPTSSPQTGCNCAVNATEPDALCAQASPAGTVTTGGAAITISGTLSSMGDVNVYSVTTTDVPGAAANSYHVAIAFTAPASNTEFIMDVERAAACSDTPTGQSVGVTSYDWCVNATSGSGTTTIGEDPCGPTAATHCNDESSPYFIRVYRAAGATPTCTQYSISVTASGGTCDLTQTCM